LGDTWQVVAVRAGYKTNNLVVEIPGVARESILGLDPGHVLARAKKMTNQHLGIPDRVVEV
jgi:hypothetical protein